MYVVEKFADQKTSQLHTILAIVVYMCKKVQIDIHNTDFITTTRTFRYLERRQIKAINKAINIEIICPQKITKLHRSKFY